MISANFEVEQESYLFELWPQDCGEDGVAQLVGPPPCVYEEMIITGAPGEIVWLWVGPQNFSPSPGFLGHEFDYQIELSGLECGVVGVEASTWSSVKDLYR